MRVTGLTKAARSPMTHEQLIQLARLLMLYAGQFEDDLLDQQDDVLLAIQALTRAQYIRDSEKEEEEASDIPF